METFFQLLPGYSSFCFGCMEGLFLFVKVIFMEFNFRDRMKMQARLHFYTEQHVFDLPLLVNMKEKKKPPLRWSHCSSKIILTEHMSHFQ